MNDEQKKAKKRTRPRLTQAVDLTIWTVNGSPLPEIAVQRFEAAIERVSFELFNEGVRVLTQTTRA